MEENGSIGWLDINCFLDRLIPSYMQVELLPPRVLLGYNIRVLYYRVRQNIYYSLTLLKVYGNQMYESFVPRPERIMVQIGQKHWAIYTIALQSAAVNVITHWL